MYFLNRNNILIKPGNFDHLIIFFITAFDIHTLLNMELEPAVKPISLQSPSFPIIGSGEVPNKSPSPHLPQSPPPAPASPPPQLITDEPIKDETQMETSETKDVELSTVELADDVSNQGGNEIAKIENTDNVTAPNRFYTPDEEENAQGPPHETVFEESESVSYVPPFNNPIYPNDSFTSYTSAIGKYVPLYEILPL